VLVGVLMTIGSSRRAGARSPDTCKARPIRAPAPSAGRAP